MASIVGFEYEPTTRIEKTKVKEAIKALRSGNLFTFGGGTCTLNKVEAELPWDESVLQNAEHDHDDHKDHEHDHDDHKDHDHDEHNHDDHKDHDHDRHDHDDHKDHDHDEHDHGDHKDHDHDHHDHDDHKDHDHESHSDIAFTYQYDCTGDVNSLTISHFQQFSLMENLKVQWISDSAQGAEDLTKSNNSFSF
jgi:hypothetical protein